MQVLKREHEKGNGDFVVKVVTCALCYLHREKFRSDLGVAFALAATLKASDYPDLVDEGGGESGAAENIVKVMYKAGEREKKWSFMVCLRFFSV